MNADMISRNLPFGARCSSFNTAVVTSFSFSMIMPCLEAIRPAGRIVQPQARTTAALTQPRAWNANSQLENGFRLSGFGAAAQYSAVFVGYWFGSPPMKPAIFQP